MNVDGVTIDQWGFFHSYSNQAKPKIQEKTRSGRMCVVTSLEGSRAATKQQGSMLRRAWETTLDAPLYHDKQKLTKKYCHPLVFVQAEIERSPFQETRGYNWEVRKRERPKRWNKWKWLTFHVKKKKLSIKRLKCFSRTQAPCGPVHNPIKDGLSKRKS